LRAVIICSDNRLAESIVQTLGVSPIQFNMITRAVSPVMGFNMIKRHDPDIAVIDLDIDANVFNLVREIRRFNHIAIIGLYSKENNIKALKTLNMGIDCCITKPLRQQEFLARVGALLRRRVTLE